MKSHTEETRLATRLVRLDRHMDHGKSSRHYWFDIMARTQYIYARQVTYCRVV